jgi:signal transduction histidine kinase
LIQNSRFTLQVEYQAVVDERTRLAREIHDGLAQTLAFLKLQAAQMQNYLVRGELEKLTTLLNANYRTLSDAYIDARQAIDDLRRVSEIGFKETVNQIVRDFEKTGNFKIFVSVDEFPAEYPEDLLAQIFRIVQEALSNIRRHAQARKIEVVGKVDGISYLIEIRDDGKGFNPIKWREVGETHYGLRGMHERAESIGAELQIISQPGQGTIVTVRIPITQKEAM